MKIKNKAGILIIALWSLCTLSAFALILSYGVRQKIMLVKRLEERSQLQLIAEAGLMTGVTQLEKEISKPYDSLNDNWSNNPAAFKDVNVYGGKFNICYNYNDSPAGNFNQLPEERFGLIDEESKININKADLRVLERLFKVVLNLDQLSAQELSASIVDWRDGDSELSIPLGSAENSYYTNLQYPYGIKNERFDILEEILLVKGMNRQIFKKIKDFITVYGNGKVNINTASKEVLTALGLRNSIVEKILSFRRAENNNSGEADFFESTSSILPRLSRRFSLSDSDLAQLSAVVEQLLGVKSDNFMIRSVACLNNRKGALELISVVNRNGKILYYRES